MKITKHEIKSRAGYILIGFFAVYLVEPVKSFVDAHLSINPFIIGIGGIIATLWYFDF